MPLGTLQDTGKALTRPFDRRVTHGGHGKTAKAAEEALRAQNGLSIDIWFEWVPSAANIADWPSRFLLDKLLDAAPTAVPFALDFPPAAFWAQPLAALADAIGF